MNNEQLESLLEEALNSVQENIPTMVQSLQQANHPFFTTLTQSLDTPNESPFHNPNQIIQRPSNPVINVLQDLSNVNLVTENEMTDILSDVSSNHLEYCPIQSDATRATNTRTTNTHTTTNTNSTNTRQTTEPNADRTTPITPTTSTTSTTPAIYDQDQINHIAIYNFASEYLDNMRLFQQNMTLLIRCLEPNRTRNRMRNTPRSMYRQTPQNVPLLTSMTDRLLSQFPNQPYPQNFPQQPLPQHPNQISMEFVATPFSFFNRPQQTVPTLQQYTDATEMFTYNSDTVSRINSITCPITLEDFQHGELLCEIKHCHHVFKESALRNWFVRNSHCPVCRYDIRMYVNESQIESQQGP